MFNWAFDHLKLETVADPAQIVSEVAVKLSFQTDYVRLLPKGEVRALVPQGLDAAGVMIVPDEKMPKSIDAPVKKGEVVGQANILYAGQVIGTVDLVAEKAARRSLILYVGNLLKKGIQSTMGKVIFAAAALVILFVLLVNVLYNYKKKKHASGWYVDIEIQKGKSKRGLQSKRFPLGFASYRSSQKIS